MLPRNIFLVVFGLASLLYYSTQFCTLHDITAWCDYKIVVQYFSANHDDIQVQRLSISDLLQIQEVVAGNMQGHALKLEQLWKVENSLQNLLQYVDGAQLNRECKYDIRNLVSSIVQSGYQVKTSIKNLEDQNRGVMRHFAFYLQNIIQKFNDHNMERAPFEQLNDELAVKIDGNLRQLHTIVKDLNRRLLQFHAFFEAQYDICQEILPSNTNAVFSKLWVHIVGLNIDKEYCYENERFFYDIEVSQDQYLQNNTEYLKNLNNILNK